MITGADRIIRLELGVLGKPPQGFAVDVVEANGQAGMIGTIDGRVQAVTSFMTNGLQILSAMRAYTILKRYRAGSADLVAGEDTEWR